MAQLTAAPGKKISIFIALFLGFAGVGAAQDITEKKDLAVFSLSYYQWQVPGGALSLVDSQIRRVFTGIGRFNVIGMEYRLDSAGIDEFISKIKEVKEREIELPETVRLGQEAFTEADFNRLIGAFILVVPVMKSYELVRLDRNDYTSRIEVSFNFINVETAEAFGYFTVDVDARADTGSMAVRLAADRIAGELVYKLKSVPEFQLKTGIIDVRGRQVLLEFGTNMGVRIGDEYAIVTDMVLPTGHVTSEETGLLVIKEVKEEISTATLIYADRKPSIGDQLREVPRFGFDTGAALRTVFARNLLSSTDAVMMIGVRQSTSRGFLTYRPIVGVDFPFSLLGYVRLPGLMVNIYGGGEMVWYLRRFQMVPTAAIGIGGSVPLHEEESFQVSHAGGFVEVVMSYLFKRDVRVQLNLGYSGWFGLSALSGDSYYGPHIGIGGTYKY
ncbi:MAG: hypothetical protein JW852_09040 [Spirochaetales bacterium]|nr:hypothetical protein [Spirochaetales bacterium]